MLMLKSVLIANRGEIARRVIRTAKRLGVRTVKPMRMQMVAAVVALPALAGCEYAFVNSRSLVGEYVTHSGADGRLVLNSDGSYLLALDSPQAGAGRWLYQMYLGDAWIALTSINGETTECDVRANLSGELSIVVERDAELVFVKVD
jgi:hypothetical protein